jgi:hypothetical protein
MDYGSVQVTVPYQHARGRLCGRTNDYAWVVTIPGRVPTVVPLELDQLSATDRLQVKSFPIGVNLGTPFNATVANANGRTISVRVLGRNGVNLRFTKETENHSKIYEYPLAGLRRRDREFIELLPITAVDSPRLAAKRKELDAAIETEDRLQADAAKPGLGGVSRRSQLKEQLYRAHGEVGRLTKELKDLESSEAQPKPAK